MRDQGLTRRRKETKTTGFGWGLNAHSSFAEKRAAQARNSGMTSQKHKIFKLKYSRDFFILVSLPSAPPFLFQLLHLPPKPSSFDCSSHQILRYPQLLLTSVQEFWITKLFLWHPWHLWCITLLWLPFFVAAAQFLASVQYRGRGVDSRGRGNGGVLVFFNHTGPNSVGF